MDYADICGSSLERTSQTSVDTMLVDSYAFCCLDHNDHTVLNISEQLSTSDSFASYDAAYKRRTGFKTRLGSPLSSVKMWGRAEMADRLRYSA